jgi:hypothetical protein
MKALSHQLDLPNHSKGVVFTIPLEHIAGIDLGQLSQFQEHLKEEL